MLLTDALPHGAAAPAGIEVVPIAALASRDAYSDFVLKSLLPHVATSHVLLVQWDGYVINPAAWDPAFLDCDYIGAKWFWHDDGMRVGNGGFSLRSRRLLEALQDPRIVLDRRRRHDHRPHASGRCSSASTASASPTEALADRFSFEAAYPIGRPFGFHGLFNFCRTVRAGRDRRARAAVLRRDRALAAAAAALRNCSALGQWKAAIAIADAASRGGPGRRRGARRCWPTRERQAAAPPAAGRNDPCPCGSGKRYKQCHGALGATARGGRGSAARPRDADALVRAALAAHQRGELDARRARVSRRARRRCRSTRSRRITSAWSSTSATGSTRRCRCSNAPRRPPPREPEFQNNLGLALAAADRNDEAIAAYRRALAAEARPRGRLEQSRSRAAGVEPACPKPSPRFAKRSRIAPDFAQAHWNLSLALLAHGEFAEGWREYEWRLAIAELGKHERTCTRVRAGTASPGRDSRCSSTRSRGSGTRCNSVRFATPLAQRGVRVVVVAAPPLVPPARDGAGRSHGGRTRRSGAPATTRTSRCCRCRARSGSARATIPAAVPYITAEPARRAQAAAALEPYRGPIEGRPRLGRESSARERPPPLHPARAP